MIKQLLVDEVEDIAFRIAQEHLRFDEPIPDFKTRYPNTLEACLGTPFLRAFGKNPYRSLVAKASILFYLLIKRHPFLNGNKRIAITTLLIFLLKNGKWLKTDVSDLYNFTIWVAESKSEDKEHIVISIEGFIHRHLRTS